MPQVILELTQGDIDTLNQVAIAAKEPGFKTPNLKGMLEYRLPREAKEARNDRRRADFNKTLEA
mgnify:FL=1